MTLQRSPRAVFERYRIENDTLKSWTQEESGLETLSKPGTKLMRLFLSPSVKVYSLYFKGSKRQRAGDWRGPSHEWEGAGDRRCRLRERVGGRPAPLLQRAGPREALIWSPAPETLGSWLWSRGGRRTEDEED